MGAAGITTWSRACFVLGPASDDRIPARDNDIQGQEDQLNSNSVHQEMKEFGIMYYVNDSFNRLNFLLFLPVGEAKSAQDKA
jgi:hypothetical protein